MNGVGKNHGEIVLAVVNNASRPVFPPRVPEDFKQLIVSCWEQDYLERPQFDEVIDSLSLMLKKYEEAEGVHEEDRCAPQLTKPSMRSPFFSPNESEIQKFNEKWKGKKIAPHRFNSFVVKPTEFSSQPATLLDSNRSLHLSLDYKSAAVPDIIDLSSGMKTEGKHRTISD